MKSGKNSELYKVEHLPSDFKKKTVTKVGRIVRTRTDYTGRIIVGCVFSKRDAGREAS